MARIWPLLSAINPKIERILPAAVVDNTTTENFLCNPLHRLTDFQTQTKTLPPWQRQ